MKWVRGRYNGKRVGGFRVTLELNLAWIGWSVRFSKHNKYIHLGFIHIWFETAYEKG